MMEIVIRNSGIIWYYIPKSLIFHFLINSFVSSLNWLLLRWKWVKLVRLPSSQGISFNLSGVIAGWTEGITYFKEGGSGVLLIPSHLAYGPKDFRGIPGGSVLIFDVELLSVN